MHVTQPESIDSILTFIFTADHTIAHKVNVPSIQTVRDKRAVKPYSESIDAIIVDQLLIDW